MRSKDGFFYYTEGKFYLASVIIPKDILTRHINKQYARAKAHEMIT